MKSLTNRIFSKLIGVAVLTILTSFKSPNEKEFEYAVFNSNLIFKSIAIDSISFFLKDNKNTHFNAFNTIKTKDSTFNVDSDISPSHPIDSNSIMVLTYASFFDFNDYRYYVFIYDDFKVSCSECLHFITLYQYNSKTNDLIQIPIGFQSSENALCFGHFNNDSSLDYVHWEYGNSMKFFSLDEHSNKFISDSNKFLEIKNVGFSEYLYNSEQLIEFLK